MLKFSVWVLRACSYKTKAEAWATGHRPPSSPRGFSGFCLASSERFKRIKGSRVQRFKSSKVQEFKSSMVQLRPIRLIRGKREVLPPWSLISPCVLLHLFLKPFV